MQHHSDLVGSECVAGAVEPADAPDAHDGTTRIQAGSEVCDEVRETGMHFHSAVLGYCEITARRIAHDGKWGRERGEHRYHAAAPQVIEYRCGAAREIRDDAVDRVN